MYAALSHAPDLDGVIAHLHSLLVEAVQRAVNLDGDLVRGRHHFADVRDVRARGHQLAPSVTSKPHFGQGPLAASLTY